MYLNPKDAVDALCMNGTYILGKTSKLKLYSVIYKLMLCGGEL